MIGAGLYQKISEFLGSVGLDIVDCHGQGCDDPSADADTDKVLQAHGFRVNPKALCTHCESHTFIEGAMGKNESERFKDNFPVPRKTYWHRKLKYMSQMHSTKNLLIRTLQGG